jgi:hypothetical protein
MEKSEFGGWVSRRLGSGNPVIEVAQSSTLALRAQSAIYHIPQPCTQWAKACQVAVGPMKRVICPMKIRKALPQMVAR